MTDNAEKLEPGWYWVRRNDRTDSEWQAGLVKNKGEVGVWCETLLTEDPVEELREIGPRIQPPQGDEG